MPKADEQHLRTIDTPSYSYMQALWMSFYSRLLYIDILKRWKGLGFGYLLLVLSLLLLPISIKFYVQFTQFLKNDIYSVIEQLPQLIVTDGKISTNVPEPYLIRDKVGKVGGIIDTGVKLEQLKLKNYQHVFIIVTRDGVWLKAPKFRYQTPAFFKDQDSPKLYTMNGVKYDTASGPEIIKQLHVDVIDMLLAPVIYLFLLSASFAFVAILFLASGGMGSLVAKLILKTHLSYAQSIRLLSVCSTPALCFLYTIVLFDKKLAFSGLIFLSLLFSYFAHGTLGYRRMMMRLVRQ